ncbi:MAG TPA: GtrA family protein [Dehalococcoidia bacterium]|nr:GtrA family protein [Dehalococcoidia bacterium]
MENASAGRNPTLIFDRIAERLPFSPEFVKFLVVGGIAFWINVAGLSLFYDILPVLPAKDTDADFGFFTHPDIRLLIASIIAVEFAVIFKFFALERWTFRNRPRRGWMPYRFLKFNLSAILSPAIVVVTVNVLTPVFGISPYISTAIGTIIGFMANYLFSAYIIWPHLREPEKAPRD